MSAIELMTPRMLQDMRRSCQLAADCLTAVGDMIGRIYSLDEYPVDADIWKALFLGSCLEQMND